jgi:hypothetical protein
VLDVRREETIKISSNPLRFTIYGLTVFMSREEELRKQGWEKRFTIDEPRLSEMVEQYKELGFEVLLEPVDTSSEECTTCLKDPSFSQLYKTIYTRRRS